MRQTNIVWVGMFLGCTFMDKIISQTLPFIKGAEKRSSYTFNDIISVLGFYLKRFYLVPKQIRLLIVYLFGYILVIVAFISFVIWNGSIVVGDKSAHQAAIHLPQVNNYTSITLFYSNNHKLISTIINFFFIITDFLFQFIFPDIFTIRSIYIHSTDIPYIAKALVSHCASRITMRRHCLCKYNRASVFVGR